MSGSLGQDYDEFKFATGNQLGETGVEENLQSLRECVCPLQFLKRARGRWTSRFRDSVKPGGARPAFAERCSKVLLRRKPRGTCYYVNSDGLSAGADDRCGFARDR